MSDDDAPGGPSTRPRIRSTTVLCVRRGQAARKGEELVVACTQEKRLFLELAQQSESAVAPIRSRTKPALS